MSAVRTTASPGLDTATRRAQRGDVERKKKSKSKPKSSMTYAERAAMRDLKGHLKQLSGCAVDALALLDTLMARPYSRERDRTVAWLANWLNFTVDAALHGPLDMSFRKIDQTHANARSQTASIEAMVDRHHEMMQKVRGRA